MKRRPITIVLLAALCGLAEAATEDYASAFLGFPRSSRSAAMADSLTAQHGRIEAIDSNPAGLLGIEGLAVSGLYARQYFGQNFANLKAAHALGERMALGVTASILQFSMAEAYQDGERLEDAPSLSSVDMGACFEVEMIEDLSAGLGVRFLYTGLGDTDAIGVAGDVGLLYRVLGDNQPHPLNIGVAVRNLGLGMKYESENEKLSPQVRAGAWYKPMDFLIVAFDASWSIGAHGAELHVGLEALPDRPLSPMLGCAWGPNTEPALTAGLHFSRTVADLNMEIDYAFNLKSQMSHTLGISYTGPAVIFRTMGRQKVYRTMAVNEFTAAGIPANEALAITEFLRSAIVRREALQVVDRTYMQQTLSEQAFQTQGCTDAACAVEIGRLLSVQLIATGSVAKLMGEYIMSVSVLDVETSAVVYSQTKRVKDVGALETITDTMAREIIRAVK